MKRILLICLILILLISLWGCKVPSASQPQDTEPTKTTEWQIVPTTDALVQQKPMVSISLPIVTESETADDGTLIFCKTYQNIALTLPESEVADKIILDFLNRTDIEADAAGILENAQLHHQQGIGSLPLWAQIHYKPMRVDQSIISLYGSYSTYSGGAHGSSSCKSVTYDLMTGKPLTLGAILTEDATAEKLISGIIKALQPIFSKGNLFDDYESIVTQLLTKDLATYTDWYLSGNGLCFYYSPYEIGPYASGDIVAEIPYSELAGLLADAYFPAEKDPANGTVIARKFESADLDEYSQIAELILAEDGEKLLLFTDSMVEDIRISAEAPFFASPESMETYMVFGSAQLTPGDAIVVQVPKDSSLYITYTTGGEEVSDTIEVLNN